MSKNEKEGIRYNSLIVLFSTVIQLALTLFFAKTIPLESLGVISIVATIFLILDGIAEIGFSGGVIQKKKIYKKQINILFYASILLAISIVVLIYPILNFFVAEYKLNGWYLLIPISIVFNQIGGVSQSIYKRRLMFKALFVVEVFYQTIFIVCILVFILNDYFDYLASFIFAKLISYLFKNILLLTLAIKSKVFIPSFTPIRIKNLIILNYFFKFGLYQAGSSLFNLSSRLLEQVVISCFLGLQFLGLYKVIVDLIILPVSRVNSIFNGVYFSKLSVSYHISKTKLTEDMADLIRMTSFLTTPIVIGIYSCSPYFSETILSADWHGSNKVFLAATIVAVLRAIGNPLGVFLYAQNKVKLAFKWNVLTFLQTLILISIFSFYFGEDGFIFSLILNYLLIHFFGYFILVKNYSNLSAIEYFILPIKSVLISIIMFLLLSLIGDSSEFNHWLLLAITIPLGGLIYMFLSFLGNNSTLIKAKQLFFSRA